MSRLQAIGAVGYHSVVYGDFVDGPPTVSMVTGLSGTTRGYRYFTSSILGTTEWYPKHYSNSIELWVPLGFTGLSFKGYRVIGPSTVSRVTGLSQAIGAVGYHSVEYEGLVDPRFWGVT